MNNELTDRDENRQRAVIEDILERVTPGVLELSWTSEGSTEAQSVTIRESGKQIRLKISQDAMEATDDPANLPRLEREIQRQLQVSEAGTTAGYVKETM